MLLRKQSCIYSIRDIAPLKEKNARLFYENHKQERYVYV